MSNKRAPGRSLEEWMELVTECRQSGLTDAAWCNEHGISPSCFYNAVTRLRKKACQIPDPAPKASTLDLTSHTFLLKPRRSGSLDPPGSFQGIKRLPCLVQQPADFLGGLGRELFIPQILFMGFFLIVPVRILLHPCFFVMLTLVITDIPELGCCITHMPDEVRIFPADLYGCFL